MCIFSATNTGGVGLIKVMRVSHTIFSLSSIGHIGNVYKLCVLLLHLVLSIMEIALTFHNVSGDDDVFTDK